MSYVTLFNATCTSSVSPTDEIPMELAMQGMENALGEFEVEDLKTETAMASLDALDTIILCNEINGTPKSKAEGMYLQVATMGVFGGVESFTTITEGYSIESLNDETQHGYALESLKRRAQGIWNWIKEQVTKLWKIIERFFYNLFGAIPNMRKKAETLRKRAAAAQGKNKEETKMEVDANTVNILADADGKARAQAAAIIKDLDYGSEIIDQAEKVYYNKLQKLGESIDGGLSGANPEDDAYLKTINDGVTSSEAFSAIDDDTKLFVKFTLKTIGTDKRFSGRTAMRLPLFANRTLYRSKLSNKSQNEGESGSELRISQVTRGLKCEVRETDPKTKKLQSQSVDVWDLTDCEKLADAIDKFCDAAESVQRGAEKGSIAKIKNKLDKSGDRFGKALENARKRTGDDSLSADQISTARSALNYVKFFGDLVAKPLPQIISLYMTGFNAALSVANKSISQYK